MNFFNFHFLFNIYIIFAHASCKTVMLKFEELSDIGKIQSMDSLNNDKSIYLDLYDYLLYTTINIGEPSQLMLGIYNPETNVFEINSNDHCKNNNNYNYSYINSKSSKIITKEEGDYYTPGYLILNDSIFVDVIEKNEKKTEIIKDFQFKFVEYKQNPWGKKETSNIFYCAELGFLINKEKITWSKFIKFLKDKNVTDSYKVTMNYTKNNEGYFYIGEFPHEYDINNFKEFQIVSTYNLDLGLIVCPVDYFNFIKSYFFKDYLNKSICTLESMSKNLNNYYMIICNDDKEFSIKSFPSLHFHHFELKKTFILDYNDLFYHKNNKYYFLIIYSSFSSSYWKLGKPFLKKYQITLDLDSKKIYFYDNAIKENDENKGNIDKKKNNSLDLKDILLICFCSILCICLVVVFIKLMKRNRKKRANELKDDDYEYKGIDNTNQNNEENQIIN